MMRFHAKAIRKSVRDSLPLQKALSVFLRVSSLAAKLLLTLYMGRYLSLGELGVYGLVFSAVMITTGVLGARLDYIVGRDLVGAKPEQACHILRDQTAFYGGNFLLFALVMAVLGFSGLASPVILMSVFAISVFESMASVFASNLISLGHPLLSTFLFFVRSGLWCVIVVAVGLLYPETRSVESILFAWTLGAALGVMLPFWFWRSLPWRKILPLPIDRVWLKASLKKSAPVWLGTIGAMTASSMDRFVVSAYLDLEKVGVVTFYSSFAFALLSLVHSGFFSFSYPRLIDLHKKGETKAFKEEAISTGIEVSLFVLAAALFLGVLMPISAPFFGKPELAAEALTFWLMLCAIWIRSVSDSFYFVLYAKGKDKPLWLGDLLYLVPVIAGNVLLVPVFALPGVGYSAVFASVCLLFWLASFALRAK